MSSGSTLKEYLQSLEEKGHGDYSVYLGTRGLENLHPRGQPLRLERPNAGEEIAADGTRKVFLRASDEVMM